VGAADTPVAGLLFAFMCKLSSATVSEFFMVGMQIYDKDIMLLHSFSRRLKRLTLA